MGKFVLFKDRAIRRVNAPAATVQARGGFGFNAQLFTELGEPESVLMYFDPEDKRVGIAPAKGGEPYAYNVRPNGHQGAGRLISAKTFMDANGIPYDKTVPVAVTFEDGMAVLDVSHLVNNNAAPMLGTHDHAE